MKKKMGKTIRKLGWILFMGSLSLGSSIQAEEKNAYFAGGCFWCMEEAYEQWEGVLKAESGYMGGHTKNPTYQEVSYTDTGHAEVVRVTYDADKISYKRLLEIFWMNVDPTQADGQFCDRGSSYRTAIYYHGEEERRLIDESIEFVKPKLLVGGEFVTEIAPAKEFWRAEGYHQDYYKRNPLRYKYYKYNCGRKKRLKAIWGDFYQENS